MKITCCQIDFASPEAQTALDLRYEVLRRPLNLVFKPDDIAEEWDSFHLAAFLPDHSLVATLILKPVSAVRLKMRQVAVSPDYQNKGIGKELVLFSENFAMTTGYIEIELHARMSALPFYKSLLYDVDGDVFEEVGIEHLKMVKKLQKI